MNLRNQRNQTKEAILNGRFVEHVLNKNAKLLDANIKRGMADFQSAFWNQRNFNVSGNILAYTHLKQHRFADMKTRQTKHGRIRKKHYQIHNKPAFGVANEIVRELTFGFTDALKAQLMQFDGQKL